MPLYDSRLACFILRRFHYGASFWRHRNCWLLFDFHGSECLLYSFLANFRVISLLVVCITNIAYQKGSKLIIFKKIVLYNSYYRLCLFLDRGLPFLDLLSAPSKPSRWGGISGTILPVAPMSSLCEFTWLNSTGVCEFCSWLFFSIACF